MNRFRIIILVLFVGLATSCGFNKKADIPEGEISFQDPLNPELNALNDAIADDPDNDEYYYKRAKIYYRMRKFELASADVNKAIELNNLKGNYFVLLANIYKNTNKLTLALNAAKKAEALSAQDAELAILISQIYFALNDMHNANYYLTQAAIMAPLHAEVFVLKGKIAASTGDSIGAVTHYFSALNKDSQNEEALKELSRMYEYKYDYDSAMVFAIRGININKREPFFQYQLGNLMQKTRQLEAAKECYYNAVGIDSSYFQASIKLADLFYDKGNKEEALRWFIQTVKYDKNNIQANFKTAQLLEQLLRGREAIPYYKHVCLIDPNNYQAKSALERLLIEFPENSPQAPVVIDSTTPIPLGLEDSIKTTTEPITVPKTPSDSVKKPVVRRKPRVIVPKVPITEISNDVPLEEPVIDNTPVVPEIPTEPVINTSAEDKKKRSKKRHKKDSIQ